MVFGEEEKVPLTLGPGVFSLHPTSHVEECVKCGRKRVLSGEKKPFTGVLDDPKGYWSYSEKTVCSGHSWRKIKYVSPREKQ